MSAMARDREEHDTEESRLAEMARLSGHGLTIALATAAFLLAGWWLDGRLGTTPLLTIVGALVGGAAGFYSLLQHMLFFPRRRAEEEEAGARERDAATPVDEQGDDHDP